MKLEQPYLLFKKKNVAFWLSLPLLYLLSGFYYLIVVFIKFAYRIGVLPSYRSSCKVISVGNITLGGTGKTPLVEWIVNYLQKEKKSPGVIIRGYKRPKQLKCVEVESEYFKFGDEASMLKNNLLEISICVGKNKVDSAKQLEKQNCEVAILDDGFQHWRLKRNLDIVTIDSTFSLFQQKLLPLGRLREPIGALKRADLFVLNKTDLERENAEFIKKELNINNPGKLIVSTVYEPSCFFDLHTGSCIDIQSQPFKSKPVLILVGIVNPIYFDKLISNLGLKIERELIYPDHYEYTKDDIFKIKELAQSLGVDTVITTQKDAERLRHLLDFVKPINIFCLKIQLKITENEEEFCNRLLSILPS